MKLNLALITAVLILGVLCFQLGRYYPLQQTEMVQSIPAENTADVAVTPALQVIPPPPLQIRKAIPDLFNNGNSINISILEQGDYYITGCANTGSMRPTLDWGAYVVIERTSNVSIGDISLYTNDLGQSVAHRIVGEQGDCWILKGDNNVYPDLPALKTEITGKVVAIIY